MEPVTVNYLAVLGAAIASYLVGWAWHSPLLFMKQWMRLSGMTKEKMQAMPRSAITRSMVIMFVSVLITSYVLGHFVAVWHIQSITEALKLGLWVWLGFYATIQLNGYLWEGKPFQLYVLEAGQTLVSTLLMAVLLVAWQ